MKNIFLFVALSFLIHLGVNAQMQSDKVHLTWGEDQPISRKIVFDDIIGSDESGIYILKRVLKGSSPLLIEQYSAQMALQKSVPVRIGKNKEQREFQYGVQINGQILLFTTKLDKKTKTNLLFAQTIDKKTLKPSSKLIKVGIIDYSDRSKKTSGSFTYKISSDEKRILIYYNLPYQKGENEKFSYHIFDSELNLLWEKSISLPYKNELFKVVDYEITKAGDLFLLSQIFKEKTKAKLNGKPNYRYQITSYTSIVEEVKEYPIILKDQFLTDMKIALNDNGEIICGGFYSNNGTFSIKGSYFLKINLESKNIVSKSFKEFGLDFITQNMTDKEKRKTTKREAIGKDVELYQYDLNDLVLREDGGAILVGEQYFVRVATYNDSQGSIKTTYHYYYNDIIVISINAAGQIDWAEKIAKRQHTINDEGLYSSYSLALVDDKLNFIFNDNIKNLVASKITAGKGKGVIYDFTRNAKSSLAVLVQVDSDGRQVKEALFNIRDAELLIRPKVSNQISNNELVIYSQKRKMERFGKITFK